MVDRALSRREVLYVAGALTEMLLASKLLPKGAEIKDAIPRDSLIFSQEDIRQIGLTPYYYDDGSSVSHAYNGVLAEVPWFAELLGVKPKDLIGAQVEWIKEHKQLLPGMPVELRGVGEKELVYLNSSNLGQMLVYADQDGIVVKKVEEINPEWGDRAMVNIYKGGLVTFFSEERNEFAIYIFYNGEFVRLGDMAQNPYKRYLDYDGRSKVGYQPGDYDKSNEDYTKFGFTGGHELILLTLQPQDNRFKVRNIGNSFYRPNYFEEPILLKTQKGPPVLQLRGLTGVFTGLKASELGKREFGEDRIRYTVKEGRSKVSLESEVLLRQVLGIEGFRINNLTDKEEMRLVLDGVKVPSATRILGVVTCQAVGQIGEIPSLELPWMIVGVEGRELKIIENPEAVEMINSRPTPDKNQYLDEYDITS